MFLHWSVEDVQIGMLSMQMSGLCQSSDSQTVSVPGTTAVHVQLLGKQIKTELKEKLARFELEKV